MILATDTIVAIATPAGRGGVGIVRLSGVDAYSIALALGNVTKLKPRCATLCTWHTVNKEPIDHGLMIYFNNPHSFTGEDVVELQAHGSPLVLDQLVKECVFYGARLARPGEFSERAFLNDKIDLTQAEAIADLINASSQKAARLAMRSLQGEFSEQIQKLSAEIINLRLYVEAAIDFPEEEIDFLNNGKVSLLLQNIISALTDINNQARQGALLREGMTLVIAGKPNAGKSTLLNKLAGKDIAIVTDIAGTTRDVLREHILLDDIPLQLIDTAGLRESDDIVEKEGIKRALDELAQAQCILLVIDVNEALEDEDLLISLQQRINEGTPLVKVFNKIDLKGLPAKVEDHTVYLAAQSGLGVEHLKELIKKIAGYEADEGQFIARRRHLEALYKAKQLLLTGQKQLLLHKAGELLAEDLRLAHEVLCTITGEFTSDDLLGKIFSSFCIGK